MFFNSVVEIVLDFILTVVLNVLFSSILQFASLGVIEVVIFKLMLPNDLLPFLIAYMKTELGSSDRSCG
jgi:hypothetical protein